MGVARPARPTGRAGEGDGMGGLALVLVLLAAGIHASWNFIAKRSEGGPFFVWIFTVVSVVCYTPVAIGVLRFGEQRAALGLPELVFLAGSGVLHIVYFLLLQQGYRFGDLSLVYPLARGTGPVLAAAGAIAFFGERPSALATCGILLVPVCIYLLAGRKREATAPSDRRAVWYGLGTGLLIASYTLWDKHAVSALGIHPIVLDLGSNVTRVLLASPFALSRRAALVDEWRKNRKAAILVGLLSPLAYILVLTALTFTPASYIAPAREVSILIGTYLGMRFLAEAKEARRRRLIGAAGMVAALVALSLG